MKKLVQIIGKRIILTPFLKSETDLVLTWRNSKEYRSLCSVRKHIVNREEFNNELLIDFSRDRHEQYIIRKKDMTPIGTIFSYDYKKEDGYVYVTTFLTKEYCNSIYGAEAHVLMLKYLFDRYSLFKIYGDVYSHNTLSLAIMKKAGYEIEGILKSHRKNKDGSRSDLYKLAVTINEKEKITEFINSVISGHFKILSFGDNL